MTAWVTGEFGNRPGRSLSSLLRLPLCLRNDAEPHQPLDRHAVARYSECHALAQMFTQKLLERRPVGDCLAVETDHEVAALQVRFRRRRSPDDLAELHAARADRTLFVGIETAKRRAERQPIAHVEPDPRRGAGRRRAL